MNNAQYALNQNKLNQLTVNILFQSLLRRVNFNKCHVHSRVWGHMVGGSKMRIKTEHVVYSITGRPTIIYKIFKIIQYIVIIILLFYVILYGNSITNFQYRLLDGMHDLPRSIYSVIPSCQHTM